MLLSWRNSCYRGPHTLTEPPRTYKGYLPQAACSRFAEIPFSSDRKYMAILACEQDGRRNALVKGAPDRILNFCSHVLMDGDRVELDDEKRRKIEKITETFAGEALRVMAGAYREFDAGKDGLDEAEVQQDLTLTGLWGMIDPPRERPELLRSFFHAAELEW